MNKTIENLLKESNDVNELNNKRKAIVKRWENTGLLEGLKNGVKHGHAKNGMAQLLENECKYLLKESTGDANVGGFLNVAFPLVRRTFGHVFAQELVSVQPMSLPSGLLFYLDFTYNDTRGPYTAGQSVFGQPVGNLIATSGTLGVSGSYLLRDSYTQRIVSGTLSGSTGQRIDGTSGSLTGSATWAEVNYDPNLSGSTVSYLLIPTGSLTSSAGSTDYDQITQIYVTTGSAVHLRHLNTPVYSSANALSYVKCFFVGLSTFDAVGTGFTTAWVAKTSATESNGITMTPVWESDFGNPVPTPVIPEVNFKINSIAVTASDRKLRAKWSPESAQDLNAYHNIDAEVEITQIMAELITLDIDLEILDMLTQASLGTFSAAKYYWSRRVGKYVDQSTGTTLSGTSWYGTRREWYETLIETVNAVGNEIYRKTLRGRANYIVCSPKIQTLLQATSLWRANASADPHENAFNIGLEKGGSLDNRYNVYVSPYFYDNLILIGYKGNSWLEVGAVYAPYVPIIQTPQVYSPEDFVPRKGMMTRYAKKIVNPSFFGCVIVEDLAG